MLSKSPVDTSPITIAPSPNNKLQGFVALLYGRGGFGKSSLLKRYREHALAATPKIVVSEIVDWEFAIREKRSVFDPPLGQAIDDHEYFNVLTDSLAHALQKKVTDFKEYQAALRGIEMLRATGRRARADQWQIDRGSRCQLLASMLPGRRAPRTRAARL